MSQTTTQPVQAIIGCSKTDLPTCDPMTLTARHLPQTPGRLEIYLDLDETHAVVPPTDYFNYIPAAQDVSKPFPMPKVPQPMRQISNTLMIYPRPQQQFDLLNTSTLDSVLPIPDNKISPLYPIPQPLETALQSPQTTIKPSPSPPPAPAPRKRARKRKALTPAAIEEKRKNFLNRNRVSANRCRERKRVWVTELEEKVKGLQSANSMLLKEKEGLVTEVTGIKEMLRSCSACECGAGGEEGGAERGRGNNVGFDNGTHAKGDSDDDKGRGQSDVSVSISEINSVISLTEEDRSTVGGPPFLLSTEK